MKYLLLLFVIPFFYLSSTAQNSLSFSRNTSVYTYIYKITKEDAYTLYRSAMHKAGEKYLYALVDSFTAADDIPLVKPGNYLFTYAKDNRLVFELKTIGDVDCKLIDNNRDLIVGVYNKNGQVINDANVYAGNKKVAYDRNSRAYRLPKSKKGKLIRIYKDDVVYFFPITRNKYAHPFQPQYKFPLKYVVRPVKSLIAHPDRYPDYFRETPYETKFRGFMAFNKPKYKPGDTVYLKAFVETRKGKPLKKDLLLRLTGRNFSTDTIITKIPPYRNGGYEYSFVLSDSLNLHLDDEYLLTLEKLRSKKYNLDGYDGDLDEEDYAMKRKVVMRRKFYYEDYELSSVSFFARSDKKEHHRNEPASIYLKATDENDMAVMDGRVQILVRPSSGMQQEFHAPKVFLPDTLWYHEQSLEPVGETKIVLPDSIFPKVSFSYEVQCVFLNTNNESQTKSLYQHFKDKQESILFTPVNDSLKIEWLVNGESKTTAADLYAFKDGDYEDTLEQRSIALPTTIKVHPFAKIYEVETENLDEEFEVNATRGIVSCAALRTKDSITLQLVNPRHLQIWYSLFAGNKLIRYGITDSLLFTDKVQTRKNYFVSLQYIYGNKVLNEEYTIPYQDKLLDIQVNQPQYIYPGQTAQIDIDIKTAAGKPVANADVTAYAFTKKFKDARTPYIPYLGKIYPLRKKYSDLYPAEEDEADEQEGSIKLNWQRWSKEMKLDTIEYFKFLHPQNLYINTEPVKDSITQIAPFVVLNGELQPIHQIYIDERPVFFSQAQQLQRYSFPVSAGIHSFRLRTQKSLVKLDSFLVTKGVKTFISINADTSNKRIRIEKMPDSLTSYEKNLWSKYMILIENNFGEDYAYIRQNEKVYLLNRENQYRSPLLVGPFPDQYANLAVKNNFTQGFETEGGWQYAISKGLIKQKQLRRPYPFSPHLSAEHPQYNFHDLVLTENEIDSLWENYLEYRSITGDLFYESYQDKLNNGSLKIGITKNDHNDSIVIRSVLLFRNNNPDFIRAYKGAARDLGYVQPGTYRLFFLLKDDAYFIKDSIVIKKDGINYYETGLIFSKPKDSISTHISNIIKSLRNYPHNSQSLQLEQIKELFNEKYLDRASFNKTISGTVKDDKANAIAGATVAIKGTRIATVTDADGRFTITAPGEGALVVSSVGYNGQELRINPEIDNYSLLLVPMQAKMSEVVVVGYGMQRRSALTGSITSVNSNMLAGRVPGLNVQSSAAASIMIRGIKSVEYSSGALIVIDGIPGTQTMLEQLDPNSIEDITVLKDEAATSIYGASAANGVVIVTTKNAKQRKDEQNTDLPFAANSLRKNFRDYAYWQPRLRTDENGRASFKTTFPDDITNWRTFVIAMGNKKYTGYAEGNIKSFKAISGNITLPQFAVQGDSINVIGKALNYLPDSIAAKRSFFINDSLIKESRIGFRNSWIDTFAVVTSLNKDSLKLKYAIERDNGYFDGEERMIPVFPQGVMETSGFFAALNKDTSFSFQLGNDTSTISLYAETSLLPVWEDEIESIRNYEYLCNEQLASKLKALLVQKKIDQYLKKDFKGEKNVLDLISKLNQNKTQSGLWGWWNNTEPSLWISLHVIEALTKAGQMGYTTSLNKPMLVDYLIYNLESYYGTEKLSALNLLYQLGAKADFKKYTDTLLKDSSKMNMYEKLRLAELRQKTGEAISLDSLLLKPNHTAFGNVYWGEEGYRFFDNSIQNTLIVYRLLRAQQASADLLQQIRNYFLEKRKTGHWRNTYESSLILETILPDLLVNDSLSKPSSLIVSGKTVTQFPYSAAVKGGQTISLAKQGSWPVYFTAYEQHWNKTPEKVAGNFEVSSLFEKNMGAVSQLKAGEPVVLKINVNVTADASYVLIEVPIPSGCSYQDKSQSHSNNEVHREYFKNKVSIFCSSLKKGSYTFSVSLLPRYTGRYTLNPAKAEMMYFPVFYGREEMKKISIR